MTKKKGKLRCSVGIFAYNEEVNIGRLLEAINGQRLRQVEIAEVYVIASGCTDSTESIVKSLQKKNKKIHLVSESERKGKASAINLFLRAAKEKILVLISADVIPQKDAIERLVGAFKDPEVGMAGSRPVPVNRKDNLIGFAVNLEWKLHYLISLRSPKMGEMVAIRRTFTKIDSKSAVDEPSIEVIISAQGYRIVYVPTSKVNNKGPETIRNFLRQRRRIYAGQLALLQRYNYRPPTLNSVVLVRTLFSAIDYRPRTILYTLGTIALEIIARLFGWIDFHFQTRDHSVWKMVPR